MEVKGSRNLHIISWNVAGWKTTAKQIHSCKGGLLGFLEGHKADVLCLQETKLAPNSIADDPKVLGSELPGFESFWACNEGRGAQRQGLNGVATFAKRGLVYRADSAPLGTPDLDAEGRCILTDHGTFVIFNAYAPNAAAGGPRLIYKLRWLEALRVAMQRERQKGKAVILVGDLNIKARPVDSYWAGRSISFARLESLAKAAEADPEVQEAAIKICEQLPSLCSALRQKEHKQKETKSPKTGETFQRWAVYTKAKDGTPVQLGSPEESKENAAKSFYIDGLGCNEDGSIVVGLNGNEPAAHIIQQPNVLNISDLAQCLKQVTGLDIGTQMQKALADAVGENATLPCIQDWMKAVMQEDRMLDSFVEVYPNAVDRFTHWNQYHNKRHDNVGTRIDYALVDHDFCKKHLAKGGELAGAGRSDMVQESAAAAEWAARLAGLAKPVGYDKSGMSTMEEDEYRFQFGIPSTGLIYTPGQLSDHIGISLFLAAVPVGTYTLQADQATKNCQPHKKTRKITDFFGKPQASAKEAQGSSAQKRKASTIGVAEGQDIDSNSTKKRELPR